MKRAPLVLTATVAGVAGVLGFHTSSVPATTAAGSTVTAAAPAATAAGATTAPAPAASPTVAAGASGTVASPSATGTPGVSGTATGSTVTTRYGPVQVEVTLAAGRITRVVAVRTPTGDRRSLQINSSAVPQLVSQTLAAQSSRIDGVSGATYTSAGYVSSLQSALDTLGFTG